MSVAEKKQDTVAPAMVPWVVVRRLALARAIAIMVAQQSGLDWGKLSSAKRDSLVRDAEKSVIEWVRAGVAVQFAGEYREADQGGSPLVQWPKRR